MEGHPTAAGAGFIKDYPQMTQMAADKKRMGIVVCVPALWCRNFAKVRGVIGMLLGRLWLGPHSRFGEKSPPR